MHKTTSIVLFALAAACFADISWASTDAEILAEIVQFHRPHCGDEPGRGGRRPELIEFLEIGGDTNRLARILAELAHTNDTWNSKMAMIDLEKYGTAEQLPFLYSCATNLTIGNYAVKASLSISGVTSNTVGVLQQYLCSTNGVTSRTVYEKAVVCRDFLRIVGESPVMEDLKGDAILVVRQFVSEVSTGVSMIDIALVQADNAYRYSKRRLSDLRAAHPRCLNEYQLNYVTNAINELVAYPEADLPD